MLRSRQQRFDISERRRITFYAAVFNDGTYIRNERQPDGNVISYTEIIRPGAFTDTLAAWGEVIADIDHDPARTFARRSDGTLLLQEDPHGLWASCWVPEGDFGDSILRDIEAGTLDGCSFQFAPVKDRTEGDTIERLAVNLVDVCLTAHPAYDGTEVHLRNQAEALKRTNFLLTKFRLLKLKGKQLNKATN